MFLDSKNKIGIMVILPLILLIAGCTGGPGDTFTKDGDSVYVDNNDVYINVTPHTLDTSGWVYAEFESKVFEGDVDFAFGFDTSIVRPTALQIYRPTVYNLTRSYVCDHDFTYTLNPNYFWCYQNLTGGNETESNITYFSHWFDSGNPGTKTAYWHKNKTREWVDWNPTNSIDYDFIGMNKWYYATDQHVQADKIYRIRYYLDVPFNPNGIEGKYTLALKPSSETLGEAIDNGHLYYLDPWFNSSYDNRYPLNITITGEISEFNDTILTYNVSNLTGVLDSLLVVYNDTSPYQWEWMKIGDSPALVNDTIRWVANNVTYVNNTPQLNFTIYVPNAFINQKNTTLFYLAEDFEDGLLDGWAQSQEANAEFYVYNNSRVHGQSYISIQNVDNVVTNLTYNFSDVLIDDTELYVSYLSLTNESPGDTRNVYLGTSGASIYTRHDTNNYVALDNGISTGILNDNVNVVAHRLDISTDGASTIANYTARSIGTTINNTLTDVDDLGTIDGLDVIRAGIGGTNNKGDMFYDDFYVGILPFNLFISNFSVETAGEALSGLVNFVNQTPGDGSASASTSIPIAVDVEYFNGETEDNITFFLYNNSQQISNITYTDQTHFHNFTGLSDDTYLFNVSVIDTMGNITASQTRTTSLDNQAPNIFVHYPNGTLNLLDNLQSLDINITLTDPIGLDTCSYSYNGTSIPLNCSGSSFNILTNLTYVAKTNNISILANDTTGFLRSLNYTWNAYVIDIARTFNNQTTEGNLENFTNNISILSGLTISNAILNYNGTNNSGQSFLNGDEYLLRKNNLVVPGVDTQSNHQFYWIVELSNGEIINLTSYNQTAFNVGIDNCTSNNFTLLNMSVYDERDLDLLPNTTVEVAVDIYSLDKTVQIINFSEISNANPTGVCLSTELLNNTQYYMDSLIRYEAQDHVNEYYNIQNLTLTNQTLNQIINLYDLNTTTSTDFKLSFIGSDFLPVENALVYLDRQYVGENLFRTVELPKTDSNGETVLHLVRNDVIYNIRIIKNNEVLGNFENLVAFCEDFTIGDCTINLNAFESGEEIFDYDSELGITFDGPNYNSSTRIVTFEFLTSDGSSKNVTMIIERNDIFGNNSVCTTSLTSSGGTLSCTIDNTIENSSLATTILVDDDKALFKIFSIDSTNFGDAGSLVYFVMVVSLILMFLNSKTMVLIGMVLGFASGVGFGLISGGLLGVGASGLWLIIIVLIGIWRLNKERIQ